MRDLVDLYFEEHSIVNHHIASFNDFIASEGKPDNRMQAILDDMRIPTDDAERGIIKLDKDRTGGVQYYIRIGRQRDESGNIDHQAPATIHVAPPTIKEANGYKHDLTPMEARLRNVTYEASVEVDFTLYKEDSDGRLVLADPTRNPPYERVEVGKLPLMVKSRGCVLDRANIEKAEERDITDSEYLQKLINAKEDPRDPGGYFIIGG
ncbi:MAG: DNA-directed RNA polymerase subunit B, partial [Candidatus Methanomethylophilaceae archaeon]|nr:DNA-directed RNA polymerase subunit B [Candidatus Methanomethylophilaceae archaeon]